MAHDSLLDALQASLTEARKARDKNRTVVLSTTLAAIKNQRIELQRELTDDDVVAVTCSICSMVDVVSFLKDMDTGIVGKA